MSFFSRISLLFDKGTPSVETAVSDANPLPVTTDREGVNAITIQHQQLDRIIDLLEKQNVHLGAITDLGDF